MSDHANEKPNAGAPETPGPAGAAAPGGELAATTTAPDRRSASIEQGAVQMMRFGYDIAERECGGDAAKLADLLFQQAKVMTRAGELLIDAGAIALAFPLKRRGGAG
jgi:hypothetical protein